MLENYRGKQRPLSFRFLTLVTLFVLSGCAAGHTQHYLRPNTDMSTIKRIAVMPFESLTADQYAGEKLRRVVISELLFRNIDVIEPGGGLIFLGL
jgi:hypothetical protein